MREPIHQGKVDWSGDNPGIFLRESADGPFVTLMVYFRIVVSPFGRGHALILLEDPTVAESYPQVANLCISENDQLTSWLVQDFVSQFGAFRGSPALQAMEFLPLTEVSSGGDGKNSYSETVKSKDLEVRLIWEQLGTPFFAELPVERSATGRHEMFSTFVEAERASILVNGRALKGQAFPRDFHGRPTSSAFLAFSESWVVPST